MSDTTKITIRTAPGAAMILELNKDKTITFTVQANSGVIDMDSQATDTLVRAIDFLWSLT